MLLHLGPHLCLFAHPQCDSGIFVKYFKALFKKIFFFPKKPQTSYFLESTYIGHVRWQLSHYHSLHSRVINEFNQQKIIQSDNKIMLEWQVVYQMYWT